MCLADLVDPQMQRSSVSCRLWGITCHHLAVGSSGVGQCSMGSFSLPVNWRWRKPGIGGQADKGAVIRVSQVRRSRELPSGHSRPQALEVSSALPELKVSCALCLHFTDSRTSTLLFSCSAVSDSATPWTAEHQASLVLHCLQVGIIQMVWTCLWEEVSATCSVSPSPFLSHIRVSQCCEGQTLLQMVPRGQKRKMTFSYARILKTTGKIASSLQNVYSNLLICILADVQRISGGFPYGSREKIPPSYAGDLGSIPGWGRSPGEGD